MLKIPDLPIYNTERYTNFSPITPDDIRPGDVYTNDSLFLYVSHFSFNKTAGYLVWDKKGEYVGTEMNSSQNIYAIVTYLNNNNFRPLDYDLEVIDPFNTDRRLLLTPNGIKKVNNVNEKYMRKKVSKLIEKGVRQVLKENVNDDFDTNDDEELSPFEEYEKGYPNDEFDVSNMTPEQLAKWCQNVGDFLYVYEGLTGLKIMTANADNIVSDIVNDLYNCQRIEPTHEVDYLFYSREREFINDYVCIFKIIGTKDGDYYIVYQEDKVRGNGFDLDESRKRLNEDFNSNELRNWFKLHGGVMKTFEKDGYPNMNVRQDALSDVNDKDILYLEEFPSYNDAVRKMNKVKKSDSYGRRSDYDMKCYFTIYRANDGMCLLVGINRNNIETGVTWGGEVSKKGSDRHWRDERNLRHKYGTNKYTDDSDTYYYSQKGNDFGLKTNHQFKGKAKDNANIRNRMSDDEWKKYQKDRVNDMDSYLRKYYGKGLKENISRVVKTVLKESFEEQWEEEIQIFLNGLKNGEALIDDGYVAVEWGHNESDPRFIYYKEGEDRLTDDHFSMQHSRRLYFDEIKEIQNLARQVYGVDIYIPDDEYYDELEDWEK